MALSKAPNDSKDSGILSLLSTTIRTINVVHDLIPSTLAQGVLSTVAGICTTIQDTIQNKKDFLDMASLCYETTLRIWRATSAGGDVGISPSILDAVKALAPVFEDILETIKSKMGRGIGQRVFQVSLDQQQMAGWKERIDHSLHVFNAELNIMANIKLDQLIAMFEEMHSGAVSGLASEALREPVPPKPPGIFGRENLIRESITSLLLGEHVALIGPGGIGKTSIAKAILHEDAIKAKYHDERHFVRFDDMNSDSITFDTFLNRVAHSLGLHPSKTNNHKRISSYLTSCDSILLVLDNSETFLEAERDQGRIAGAIDEFGALHSVKIILTTRTGFLPQNLICKRLPVVGLEPDPARLAFLSVYRKDISPPIVDKLLTALDFHPLSINLLAHAAAQNEWSAEDLTNAWETQRTKILDSGTGKTQSLAVSIELSLNSRSITKLQDSAIDLLQLISFLPQGIDGKKLNDIFPTVKNIHATADALCNMSLTYRSGASVTMLSPIRLYLTEKYLGGPPPYSFPFLQHIRTYYHSQLITEPQSLQGEDINVERLIAHDLTIPNHLEINIRHCLTFLDYLCTYPRPTGLGSIITTLPDSKPTSHTSHFLIFLGFLWPHFGHRHRISIYKAKCLQRLAYIACDTGHENEAQESASAAYKLFLAGGIRRFPAALDTALLQATIFTNLGKFIQAEDTLNIVWQSTKWVPESKWATSITQRREEAQCSASIVMAFRGKFQEAARLIQTARQSCAKRNNDEALASVINDQGYILLFQRHYGAARRCFEESHELVAAPECLRSLSEVAYQEGLFAQANNILDEAGEIGNTVDESGINDWLEIKAARFADTQEFELARDYNARLAYRCKDKESDTYALAQYSLARIELLASNYPKSKELFSQCTELFDMRSNVRFKARSLRALGEILLLEKDKEAANRYFTEVSSICKYMGIHPRFLYVCFSEYWLDDEKFVGWKLFYENTHTHNYWI